MFMDAAEDFFDDSYLESFSRGRGLELTSGRDPDARYMLEDGEVNLYTHEPSMDDLLHPFRPSGDFLAEVLLEGRRTFFWGEEEAFGELDSYLMDRIEPSDPGQYKEVHDPNT